MTGSGFFQDFGKGHGRRSLAGAWSIATPESEEAEREVTALLRQGRPLTTVSPWDDLADDMELTVVHEWDPRRSVAAFHQRAGRWDGISRTQQARRRRQNKAEQEVVTRWRIEALQREIERLTSQLESGL